MADNSTIIRDKVTTLKRSFLSRLTGKIPDSDDAEEEKHPTEIARNLNEEILNSIEEWLMDNKIQLLNSEDFGLKYEQIQKIHEIVSKIAGVEQRLSIRQYLKEMLLRQLDLEVDLLKIKINEEQGMSKKLEAEAIRKSHEREQHKAQVDIAKKDSEIAELTKQIAKVDEKYKDAEGKLAKLVTFRLNDKSAISQLENEKKALNDERQQLFDNLSSIQNERDIEKKKNDDLESELEVLRKKNETITKESEKKLSEVGKIKIERDKLAAENARINGEIDRLTSKMINIQQNNRKLLESQSKGENIMEGSITLLFIDLNNIVRSFNDAGLRLFDPKEFFNKIETLIPQDSTVIIGFVFHSPHLKHHKAITEKIRGYTWITSYLKKGYIEGTQKAKYQDVDTSLATKAGEHITRYAQNLNAMILASGDKDMIPVIECCRANAKGCKIIVVGRRDSIAVEIAESCDSLVQL